MKQSKFFSLKARDFIKGFIMAVITAIAMGIYTSIDSGTFPPDAAGWKTMLLTGLWCRNKLSHQKFVYKQQWQLSEKRANH